MDPGKIIEFDPLEFCMVMDQASLKARLGPKRTHEEMLKAQCLDSTMMNFGVAVAQHYQGDRVKADSFIARWMALGIFLSSGELEKLYPNVDPDRLRRCATEVAASARLTRPTQLERETFLSSLADRLGSSS